jgi:hypothetical protein
MAIHSAETPDSETKATLQDANKALTLDLRERDASRLGIQQTVMQCITMLNLDAVTYPTGNVPPADQGTCRADMNGRSHQAWTLLGTMGFRRSPFRRGSRARSSIAFAIRWLLAARGWWARSRQSFPSGLTSSMPFGEPTLFKIASAYEAAIHHRISPPEFGPLAGNRTATNLGFGNVVGDGR